MILHLDIEKKARYIKYNIYTLRRSYSLVSYGLRFLHNTLDEFILSLEGYQNHVLELDKDKLVKEFNSVKKISGWFDKLDGIMAKSHYANDVSLKDKFRFLLKLLYKMESSLHVAIYKNLPKAETEAYIKEGLSGKSSEAIAHSLSKLT